MLRLLPSFCFTPEFTTTPYAASAGRPRHFCPWLPEANTHFAGSSCTRAPTLKAGLASSPARFSHDPLNQNTLEEAGSSSDTTPMWRCSWLELELELVNTTTPVLTASPTLPRHHLQSPH